MHKVKMRVNAWFGDSEIEIAFPDHWKVVECRMAGHNRPQLSEDEVRACLCKPIGTQPLREIARGKRNVVILFDDLPKPTPAHRIVPLVIEELHAGGVDDEQIRFVCALATHRPLIYPEFAAKLGTDIISRYPVYNHNPYEHLVYVGTTSRGTPVHINREYTLCDLRIGIGGIIPHAEAGFGGGSKIILPGITGVETVVHHHKQAAHGEWNATKGLGCVNGNIFRLDMDDAARLADLHFKVDVVLNNHREIIGLFAGDFVEAFHAGVKLAREIYRTEPLKDADVVVSNSYPDESQFRRSTEMIPISLREGGEVVVITHSFEGQNQQYWAGRFGTNYGGCGWSLGGRAKKLAKAKRILVMSPFLSKVDRAEFGPPEKVSWCKDWDEVVAELASRHGAGTRVAVYPYAPLQLLSG